jgi:diguanylate cyclase (GGDEF)-like protein/putative nucleotidyltransferase with HDIG domain
LVVANYSQTVKDWTRAAPWRSWIFLAGAGVWGLVELATLSGRFQSQEPARLSIYLLLVAVSSCFRLTQRGSSIPFSLNLPFLLVSILDLSLPEATLAGGVGALFQAARTASLRHGHGPLKGALLTALAVGMQTMAVATAGFAFQSLLPAALTSVAMKLAVASLLLFAANTLPVAMAIRLGGARLPESPVRVGEVWKTHFWAIPYYLVGAALALAIRLGPSMISSDQSLLVMVALYLAFRQYRVQKQDWEGREKHAADMTALHLRAIEGLALAVEAKDVMNTRGHLRRVQVYALGIGRAIGLSQDDLEALHAGSLLHDIGKLAVPEHILTKPGKLTAEEFAKMKVHPLVGAEIVDQMQFPYAVAPIVRAHHEKWDGSGYPYGLKGEQIPIGARILSVVDFLDAMTSDREYRPGVPVEEAMSMLREQAGTSFDPKVVAALEANLGELEQAARTQAVEGPVLSTGVKVERGAAPDAGLDLVGLAAATGAAPLDHVASPQSILFRQLSSELGGIVELPSIFDRADRVLASRLPFDALAVFLPRGNVMAADFARGCNALNLAQLEIPVGQGVTGWVAQNVQPMVNGNPSVDPGYRSAGETLQSVLAVPMMNGDRMEGVLSLYRLGKDAFNREEARLIGAVSPALASAIQSAGAHQQIQVNLNTDPTTGVPNSTFFQQMLGDELKRAERRRQSLCLVVIDLRELPKLRAETGNARMEALLGAISGELQRVSRDYDRVGRLGEDRFGLLLPGLGPANVAAVVSRLRNAVEQTAMTAGEPLRQVMLSGAFYPEDGEGARHILGVAESRLEQGMGNWEASLDALRAASGKTGAPVRTN